MWTIFLYSSERKDTLINIKFISEKETKNKISFLEIEISRDKNQFIASVYCELTYNGVSFHFDSFIPGGYKFNLYL